MDHGAAAEDNAHADEDARDDRRRRMEMIERIQYDAGQKDGYGDEKAADSARTARTRLFQILVVPAIEHGWAQQLDGKQKLYGANEQAAEIQGERQGAQRQGHIVDNDEILAADAARQRILAAVRRDL